jgi:hypothetical protein
VSLALRQLQLHCVPGVCIPIQVAEAFLPPGTLVTALETKDEPSATLTIPAALSWQHRAGSSLTDSMPGQGRGTFNVQLCWPKALLKAGAPQESSLQVAPRENAPIAAGTHFDAAPPGGVLTRSDVEVLATVKLHRAWIGLQVDDKALLTLVQQRAEAAAAGNARSLPPLFALELSFRPAALGSSFSLHGVASPPSSSATRHADAVSAVAAGTQRHAAPLDYVLGLDLPPWIRTQVEAQAVEVHGDVPVLTEHFGAMLNNLWSSMSPASISPSEHDELLDNEHADDPVLLAREFYAAVSAAACDTLATRNDSKAESSTLTAPHANRSRPRVGSVDAMMLAGGSPPHTPAKSIESSDSQIHAAEKGHSGTVSAEDAVSYPQSEHASSSRCRTRHSFASTSSATHTRSMSMSSTTGGSVLRSLRPETVSQSRVKEIRSHAAAARNTASFQISRIVKQYLQSEDLRIESNLQFAVMSLPRMPVPGLQAAVSSSSNTVAVEAGVPPTSVDSRLLDIAGILDSPPNDGSSGAMHRVMIVQIAAFSKSQPSIIPLPGSGFAGLTRTKTARREDTSAVRTTTTPERPSSALNAESSRARSTSAITATEPKVPVSELSQPSVSPATSEPSARITVGPAASPHPSSQRAHHAGEPTLASLALPASHSVLPKPPSNTTNDESAKASTLLIDFQLSLLSVLDDLTAVSALLQNATKVQAAVEDAEQELV